MSLIAVAITVESGDSVAYALESARASQVRRHHCGVARGRVGARGQRA